MAPLPTVVSGGRSLLARLPARLLLRLASACARDPAAAPAAKHTCGTERGGWAGPGAFGLWSGPGAPSRSHSREVGRQPWPRSSAQAGPLTRPARWVPGNVLLWQGCAVPGVPGRTQDVPRPYWGRFPKERSQGWGLLKGTKPEGSQEEEGAETGWDRQGQRRGQQGKAGASLGPGPPLPCTCPPGRGAEGTEGSGSPSPREAEAADRGLSFQMTSYTEALRQGRGVCR